MLRIDFWEKRWPMAEPFAIARGVQLDQPTLQISLTDRDGLVGRGEACGVPYAGETPETMAAQVQSMAQIFVTGFSRQELLSYLPAGGARHAVDAALWDLEAKQTDRSVFDIAGLAPQPVVSARTIGIRSIEAYGATALKLRDYAVLKVKVNSDDPLTAIRAVRKAAPSPKLIVDPNQSWSVGLLKRLAPELSALGVVLIEQPIAVGAEAGLDGWRSPVPLCADELIDDVDDLDSALGRYQVVNIKLDKSGGLTAALKLADAATERGFRLMVGCMAGSSLSMAPAMVLAQRCEFVDLDGPLLQSEDCAPGLIYESGRVQKPHVPQLWG